MRPLVDISRPGEREEHMLDLVKKSVVKAFRTTFNQGDASTDEIREHIEVFDPAFLANPEFPFPGMMNTHSMGMIQYQISANLFLPRGKIWIINGVNNEISEIEGDLVSDGYSEISYLSDACKILYGEVKFTTSKSPDENACCYGAYLFMDSGLAEYDSLSVLTVLNMPEARGRVTFWKEYNDLISNLALTEEGYSRVCGSGRVFFNNLGMCQASTFSNLLDGSLNLRRDTLDPVFVRRLVRPTSNLLAHVGEGSERPQDLDQALAVATAVDACSTLAGFIQELKSYSNREQWTTGRLAAADFIFNHWMCSRLDTWGLDFNKKKLTQTSKWIQHGLISQGLNERESIRKVWTNNSPKRAVQAVLEASERLYAKHFYTDAERLAHVHEKFGQ